MASGPGRLLARPLAVLGARAAVFAYALFVGFAAYGAVASGRMWRSTEDRRVLFPTLVQDKHVSHGRSTSYYLSLGPFAGRHGEDVSVGSERYDRTEVGGLVCVATHPGAASGVTWFADRGLSGRRPARRRRKSRADQRQQVGVSRGSPTHRLIEGSAVVECTVTDSR